MIYSGKKHGSILLVVFFCILSFSSISTSHAGEGYGTHAALGAEDVMAGALPPPGTKLLINYFGISPNVNRLKDNAGRDQAIPGLGKIDVKTSVVVNSIRYLELTKYKILGGDFLWNVIVPFVYQHTTMSAGLQDIGKQSKTGLGDIEFGVGIQWHRPTLHNLVGFEIIAPTGSYDSTDFVNIGRNYWSFNPVWAITYLGDKTSPVPGFEATVKMMYFYNTINADTSYTSGQEFTTDYFIGQHIGKWAVGATGNFYYQLTDDKQYGRAAIDPFSGQRTGVRGMSFTAGPLVQYNFGKVLVTAKYHFSLQNKNRPETDMFWLKLIFPF